MQDLRLAFRGLRAAPVVSAVAILSLALGIGANTAIFSFVDRLVLRALPVEEPHRLVMLVDPERPQASWTNPIWERLRERLDLFGGGFAWASTRLNLARAGEARLVNGIWASGGFFDTLAVPPHLGRTFTPADDRRGGGPDGPVVVISYDFWQRSFGGAPDAIGRALTIGSVTFTVIGVTPPRFFGPDVGRTFDVILPLGTEPLLLGANSALDLAGRFWLDIMLRLAPGQTEDAAAAIVRGLQPQIRAATAEGLPDEYLSTPLALAPASHGRSPLRTRFQQPLALLIVVVALVLLVACANLANLLLARAAARQHDVSVRIALGAPRWRLACQCLVESLVLSSLGAVLGLLFARWTGRLLMAQLSTDINPVFLDLTLDWRVLGFTTALAAGTALLFGTAPALRATRVDAMPSLDEQGRGSAGGSRSRVAGTLVVFQVALSLTLVVAAGLFVRTFVSLATLDPGFTTDRLLVVNVRPQMTRIETGELTALYERAREAVAAVPGVERAALSDITPISGSARVTAITVPGRERPEAERLASVNVVSPGWFAVYGSTLLAGRDFREDDRRTTARVAVVNEAFARRFLNGENPVGRTIRDGADTESPIQIVGYTADAAYRSLRDPAPPTMYTAFPQRPAARPFVSITVRSSTEAPATLTRSLAAAIGAVSPDLDLQFRPLADQVGDSLAQERVAAILAGFFGGLALLLAGLGLYGVTAHAVARRRAEIGVRMALGAAQGGIVRLILRRVAVMVLAGIAAGGILSWWAARFVSDTLLYGLDSRDPGTLAGAAAILALVGVVAGWLPAWRAARIDPAAVLRDA
ncbi:MAG: ABC transporter permease [Acidobacteria bacterium]|nr:ABC transporter permease [Acidobacteriota bacterium]